MITKLHAVLTFAAGVGVGLIAVGALVLRHTDQERTAPKIVLQPQPTAPTAVDAGPGDWRFTNWKRSMFSDDTPDCAGVVSPPLPESAILCSADDGRNFRCAAWRVELSGVHPNAGYATVRATYRGLGSSGDPCDVAFLGDARAAR